MARYNKVERVGINAVEQIVAKELEWIWREQMIADMGIDAHIELVDGDPTGRLIAVQVKTGLGNFTESKDALVYYGDLVHLDYWTGHSLPVILVAHLPDTGQTLWAAVNEETVKRTNRGWKITIPKENVFGSASKEEIARFFDGTPAQQRLRKLAIDEPLMRHIKNGGKVTLELEEWINKSLGRTPVRVFLQNEDGNETLSQDYFTYYVGYGIKELAEALFPWSTVSVDEEFYEQHSEFEETDMDRLRRATDEDNGIFDDLTDSYDVHPYREMMGEVEYYRLKLELNDLGESFLVVTDFLAEKPT